MFINSQNSILLWNGASKSPRRLKWQSFYNKTYSAQIFSVWRIFFIKAVISICYHWLNRLFRIPFPSYMYKHLVFMVVHHPAFTPPKGAPIVLLRNIFISWFYGQINEYLQSNQCFVLFLLLLLLFLGLWLSSTNRS